MNTLELQQASGQWRYRILAFSQLLNEEQSVKVDWQWGSFNKQETIQQARDRFGSFEKIVIN
jgi:hypothetical protein